MDEEAAPTIDWSDPTLRQAFWGTGFGILVAVLAIATWRYGPYALRSDLDAARTEIAALKSRLDALEKK